jgi:formate hydrogenlyase transcriptional activator
MSVAVDSATTVDARYLALVEVAGVLASHVELHDLLHNLRTLLEPLIHFELLAVYLRDGESNTITLRLKEMQNSSQRGPGASYSLDDSLPGTACRTGRSVYVPRLQTGGPPPSDKLIANGIVSCCAVPLTTPRRALGALTFGSSRESAYTPDEIEFMERVAGPVAVAVENALSLETVRQQQTALQRERDQLGLLLDVTNAVVSELDIGAVFRAVAPALRRCCRADAAALMLFDAEAAVLRKHACDLPAGMTEDLPPIVEFSLDGTPSGLVFRTGEARIFSESELAGFSDSERLRRKGIRSYCSVPLATVHGVLGTLNIAAFEPNAFSADQLPLLQQVASQIAIAVSNAISYKRIEELNAQLAQEKIYLEDEIRSEQLFEEIVGRSAALRRVLKELETVGPTDSTVLISGETGSGKELVARAIHQLSKRREHAFVKLNCAAIPTGLVESELFGHEKGAFTGAINQRIGRFELAHRGSVFLDEIGEVPLELQPKLLRVLQEREFERLGSARTLRTDARLIAATNRDLAALVEQHQFREDLFYRLNVFPIVVPPLRERREDIPTLVRHFAQQFARRMSKTIETIPAETMNTLTLYDWPGNIRELQNLIERAVILSPGPTLEVPVVTLSARRNGSPATHGGDTLEQAERRHITTTLIDCNWVIAGPRGAAARLGMKRSTLQFRMRKLGIARPQ